MKPMRIAILTTGGTIEKRYNESDGSLSNVGSALDDILAALRLPDARINHYDVMSKDSNDMTPQDREVILAAVRVAGMSADGVLIIHGTDTLALTGEHLHANLIDLTYPVVLTGAMRPYMFRNTDAYQNVTEGLLACRLCRPGVYVAMHNQVLAFPGVKKDRDRLTFRRAEV